MKFRGISMKFVYVMYVNRYSNIIDKDWKYCLNYICIKNV